MSRVTDFFTAVSAVLAIAVLAESIRTIHHAEAIVFHGPGGQPAAIVTGHGIVHILASDVPVWRAEAWAVDIREMSLDLARVYRDAMVQAADWQGGYQLTNRYAPGSVMAGSPPDVNTDFVGFSLGKGSASFSIPGTWFIFASAPAWAVIPLLAVFPLLRIKRSMCNRRRNKRGQCEACGYDLRASPDRCPECGAVPRSVFPNSASQLKAKPS